MSRATLIIGNYNYSSWSLRAWLTARHAALEMDIVRIALDVPGYREELYRHSPAGRVPVLMLNGQAIWDSMAIALALAEQAPHLWPDDRALRHHAYSLAAEMHSGFPLLRARLPMNCRATGRKVPVDEALALELERIDSLFQSCPRTGPGWLFGEFSIADAMYAPVVSRLRTYAIATSAATARYIETVLADPFMQGWYDEAARETETIDHEEVGL